MEETIEEVTSEVEGTPMPAEVEVSGTEIPLQADSEEVVEIAE